METQRGTVMPEGPNEWEHVQPMALPILLDRIGLHDSYFGGLRIDGDSGLTLEIQLDRVWNPSIPEGFDTLALRFDHAYRARWIRGADEGEFNSYFAKSDGVVVHPAEDASLTRTRFEFLDHAVLEILHGGSVRALLRSEAGTIDVSTIADSLT
jgi:hypothetical protein